MLGHQVIRTLAPDFEVWGSCRNPAVLPDLGIPVERLLGGLDAGDFDAIDALIGRVRPDLVINAIGIVKQLAAAKTVIPSITINSLLPHVLADACDRVGARMVHVGTDCVFSGALGGYREDDAPDAWDLYGRSKLLGEVTNLANVVTVRTSIIGWQIGEPTGLVGWFAAHRDEPLRGFTKAIFSGLTTRALSEVIRDVVVPDATLCGLWHVAAEPIDKYTLLSQLAGLLGWDVDLMPSENPVIDRSLDGTRFRERTGWTPPTWDAMLEALAEDYTLGADRHLRSTS